MFCPNCGTESEGANRYCKRCGEWLHDQKALARYEFGGTSPEQNLNVMFILSGISALVALVCAFLLYLSRTDASVSGAAVYVTAALCLTIALWQFSNLYVGLKLRKRFRQRSEDAAARAREPQTGAALPEAPETGRALDAADTASFVGARRSVIDRTTELIQPADRRARDTGAKESDER